MMKKGREGKRKERGENGMCNPPKYFDPALPIYLVLNLIHTADADATQLSS